jgi:hypothetical protein
MIKNVKAVWLYSMKEASEKFSKGFSTFPSDTDIFFCVDKSEQYWFGSMIVGNNSPKVGDPLEMKEISKPEEISHWETVRRAIICHNTGEPNYGETTWSGEKQKIDNLNGKCRCDIYTLTNRGCPSAKGKPCPNA